MKTKGDEFRRDSRPVIRQKHRIHLGRTVSAEATTRRYDRKQTIILYNYQALGLHYYFAIGTAFGCLLNFSGLGKAETEGERQVGYGIVML